jgi:hypothetical protein
VGRGIAGVQLDDPRIRESGLINVYVDEKARMDVIELQKALQICREYRKPVLLAVAVIGSTEESAVDPLTSILYERNVLRNDAGLHLDFNVHADAAWGGYLISSIRKDFDLQWPQPKAQVEIGKPESPFIEDTRNVPLSKYVIEQLEQIRYCDSVTVDPHKWGYIPYPAGSLCYRNGKMINLVTFGAPYIGSDVQTQVTSIGESGVEGSKPGAAAAAVFLSHSVIRPSRKGYGKLVQSAVLNARIFYLYVCAMASDDDPFFVVPLNGIPDGPAGEPGLEYIKSTFYETDRSLEEILENESVRRFIKTIGSDQNFVDYVFNFYVDPEAKIPNRDPQLVTDLHDNLFGKVYPQPGQPRRINDYNIMISKTVFHRQDYGPKFMDHLARRLRLEEPWTVEAIPCMRSVVMDPWVIETKVGDERLNFFREVFIPELRCAVSASIRELVAR